MYVLDFKSTGVGSGQGLIYKSYRLNERSICSHWKLSPQLRLSFFLCLKSLDDENSVVHTKLREAGAELEIDRKRAHGFYGSSGQEDTALFMAMNFVFLEGKYNGSTISILGRNHVFSKEREMPVIGGTGLFRFARGYAQANTFSFSTKTGDAVVEYNVYVSHYRSCCPYFSVLND
ncbi:hypothetical protein SADUNF_Sadunf03G0117800 [Salix dunnii]|uniref:Dirigent protein n=1 Tax=Salix dunnii TaxID=1413687 RepID=A0A835N4D3_9ROSI|nr:hypothetical protein SADUNF_Sadunf03G0117800 [Salix dunnii]